MPELCAGRGPKIRSNQDLFQETRATVSVILTLWLRAIWSLMVDRLLYGPYTFCKICEHFFSVPGILKPGMSGKDIFGREKSCCPDYLLGLYCALSSKFRLMLILMEPIKDLCKSVQKLKSSLECSNTVRCPLRHDVRRASTATAYKETNEYTGF